MKLPPTMNEVAAVAGVHQTTVSLALRNHPSLPRTTCERIQKLAKKMGYRPNPLVSAFIAERKKRQPKRYGATLAFLTSSPASGSWRFSNNYSRVFQALSNRAWELGYRVEEFWLREPGMTPQRMRQILLNRGVRGIIVCPLPDNKGTLDFDFSEFATVALGLTLETPHLDRVVVDFYAIFNLATHKLLETGHRRIGFLTTTGIDRRVNHLYLSSFLSARHLQPESFLPPFTFAEWPPQGLRQWLRTHRPDALIIPTERDYTHLRDQLVNFHIPVPEKLSLICLDCSLRSGSGGVVQNLEAEGRVAVDLVTSWVERAQFGIPALPQITQISGGWRDGESIRPR